MKAFFPSTLGRTNSSSVLLPGEVFETTCAGYDSLRMPRSARNHLVHRFFELTNPFWRASIVGVRFEFRDYFGTCNPTLVNTARCTPMATLLQHAIKQQLIL
jgi:hypothetical protein